VEAATTPPRRADAHRVRARVIEVATEAGVVVAVIAIVGATYALVHAPLFNEPGSIDPWLYTALWTNFHQVYSHFVTTYYASRLPWIVPGYVANAVFGARVAYFAVHGTVFVLGGLFVFLLCRRFFGLLAAVVGLAALLGSQMFWNANRWDYWEGGTIAMLAASVYFATPQTSSQTWRLVSLACAGSVVFSELTTLVITFFYLVGVPIWYAIVGLARVERARRTRQLLLDVSAFAAGVAATWIAFGLFARANGGPFMFFLPQLRFALSTTGSYNHQSPSVWLVREPRFWIPLFTLAVGILAWRAATDTVRRALAAANVWTATTFVLLCVWEFARSGFAFEYTWYSSQLLVLASVVLAGVAAVLAPAEIRRADGAWTVVASLAAVLAPIVWLYHSSNLGRSGRPGYPLSVGLMVGTAVVVFLLLRSHPLRRLLGGSAAALVLFAASYTTDVSYGVYLGGERDASAGSRYSIALDLQRYLRQNGYSSNLPYFWYDQSGPGELFASIQSLYYYSYTYVGTAMPTIDDDFRLRMSLYKPSSLVLLCPAPSCDGARATLARTGYAPRLLHKRLLARGDVRMWVEIYELGNPPQ
jgi:hypothetical protein